ncbi:MAG: 3-deoxy-D-manno-octulosonic acid transferase [Alphaproteobacteria bacterium]|nr:3-deoxy-D-manno-octulosonic acid transferase [Alphaproteobacteria bacterium]
MIAGLYRALTTAAGPAILWYLRRRRARGKEDAARFAERLGHDPRPRPPGPLLWCHGASVGEALGALPLVARLRRDRPDLAILMTSGTTTAAAMLAERLPPGAFHAYVPADRTLWVRRFLDHWRPDLALWMESELWPNLIAETARRGTPMALLNARMSARSLAGWRRFPGWARQVAGAFALVLAPDAVQAARFRALGAPDVRVVGNLKAAAALPAADPAALAGLTAAIGDRPRWLAASTHPGEEAPILDAHRRLRLRRPDLLLVLVPRHPERGPPIAEAAADLAPARRASGHSIVPATGLYVGDTLGEMGLFFRLADIVFLGGSLDVGRGGHNPIEPALAGAAIVHGPDMANFSGIAQRLEAAGATRTVRDAAGIAAEVGRLLDDPAERARRSAAAAAVAAEEAGALERTIAALAPLLDRTRATRAPA